MKTKIKQARQTRRKIKKFFRNVLFLILLLAAAVWAIMNYSSLVRLVDRFFVSPIETKEINTLYDHLKDRMKPGQKLVTDLDLKDAHDTQSVMKRLQEPFGLKGDVIGLAYTDKISPPGFIHMEGDQKTIFLSTTLKTRRERTTVLVHELGHIYVWNLPKYEFDIYNQEKLVDVSAMFLGLGVMYLNGMTDEFRQTPEGGYQSEKKTFGYLEPQQFGYLLARYCRDHGISENEVKPHLNDTGWKYFKMGNAYLNQKTKGVETPEIILRIQSEIRKLLQFLRAKIYDGGAAVQKFIEQYQSKPAS